MAFQSTVRQLQAFGVIGEIIRNVPVISTPWNLVSDPVVNTIGNAFTVTSEGVAECGGTGAFAGILVNPKSYTTSGTTAGGTLAPSLDLPDNSVGELLTAGEIVVTLTTAASIGDAVIFDESDGSLDSIAPVAAFTASQATTVLTVTAITAGSLNVGSVVKNASGEILGEIIALGTGTGGTGTYTMSTSATVGSAAMTANTVAVDGFRSANATVVRFDASAGGLAVIQVNATPANV
jgi:hypothetical protein